MKEKLKSLRIRMLLPVIVMAVFVVTMLTTLFSRAYISMIVQQEQEVNDAGFETVSRSVTQLINAAVIEVRSIMSDDRVASYASGIFGLLIMRQDGSLFGVVPEATLFLDDPRENPLSEDMKTQIMDAPLGQTVWTGPVSGAALYGFENKDTPQNIMIAAWKTVDVRYGTCYEMVLIDESVFDKLFAPMQDGKSIWRFFTADQTEFYYTGQDACSDPQQQHAADF